jgi:hypothetical protein
MLSKEEREVFEAVAHLARAGMTFTAAKADHEHYGKILAAVDAVLAPPAEAPAQPSHPIESDPAPDTRSTRRHA